MPNTARQKPLAISAMDALEARALLAQTPFNADPYPAPGLIEAENFDLGGEGEAYHDYDAIRQGTSPYRPDEKVDLDAKGANGVSVGYIRAGEWLEYTVRFDAPGTFRIDTSVASKTGGSFHYDIDEVNETGEITLPNTGGWSTFKTVSSAQFNVAGGTHVVRLSFDKATVSTDIGVVDAFSIVKIEDEPIHPDRLKWKSAKSSPIEREEAQSLVYDGKLYVLGGYRKGFTATRRVDAYDPVKNTWTRKKDMPYSITHAAVVADLDGKNFYFLGGFEGSFERDHHGHSHGPPATKKVYKYNAETDTWTRLVNMPNSHGGGGAGIVDNKLYFFGGADLKRKYDRKEMYVLDLAEQSHGWKRATDFINPRNHLGGITVNGKIYAIGGQYGLEDESVATKRVDVYDPAANAWSRVADMPNSLSHFNAATVLYDRYIITVGGENPHNEGKKYVFCYDTEQDKWHRMTDLPGSRRAGVAGIVGTTLIQSTGWYRPQGQTTTTWVAELRDVFG